MSLPYRDPYGRFSLTARRQWSPGGTIMFNVLSAHQDLISHAVDQAVIDNTWYVWNRQNYSYLAAAGWSTNYIGRDSSKDSLRGIGAVSLLDGKSGNDTLEMGKTYYICKDGKSYTITPHGWLIGGDGADHITGGLVNDFLYAGQKSTGSNNGTPPDLAAGQKPDSQNDILWDPYGNNTFYGWYGDAILSANSDFDLIKSTNPHLPHNTNTTNIFYSYYGDVCVGGYGRNDFYLGDRGPAHLLQYSVADGGRGRNNIFTVETSTNNDRHFRLTGGSGTSKYNINGAGIFDIQPGTGFDTTDVKVAGLYRTQKVNISYTRLNQTTTRQINWDRIALDGADNSRAYEQRLRINLHMAHDPSVASWAGADHLHFAESIGGNDGTAGCVYATTITDALHSSQTVSLRIMGNNGHIAFRVDIHQNWLVNWVSAGTINQWVDIHTPW